MNTNTHGSFTGWDDDVRMDYGHSPHKSVKHPGRERRAKHICMSAVPIALPKQNFLQTLGALFSGR